MSDTIVIYTIIIAFVALGAILPFINEAFNQQDIDFNAQNVEFQGGQNLFSNTVTVLGVITSVVTMFFWTFGAIPAIIDLVVFTPIRIMFAILLYKLILRVGG